MYWCWDSSAEIRTDAASTSMKVNKMATDIDSGTVGELLLLGMQLGDPVHMNSWVSLIRIPLFFSTNKTVRKHAVA